MLAAKVGFGDLPLGRHCVVLGVGASGLLELQLVQNQITRVKVFEFTPFAQVTIALNVGDTQVSVQAYDSCGRAHQQVVSFDAAEAWRASSAPPHSAPSPPSTGAAQREAPGKSYATSPSASGPSPVRPQVPPSPQASADTRMQALQDVLQRLSELETRAIGLRSVRQQLLDVLKLYSSQSLIMQRPPLVVHGGLATERKTDQHLQQEKDELIKRAQAMLEDVAAIEIGVEQQRNALANGTAVPEGYAVPGLPAPAVSAGESYSGSPYLLQTAQEAYEVLGAVSAHYHNLKTSVQSVATNLTSARSQIMAATNPVIDVQALGEPSASQIRNMAEESLARAKGIRVQML